MNRIIVVSALLFGMGSLRQSHVTPEYIQQVKQAAKSWQPVSYEDYAFKDQSIYNKMGAIITQKKDNLMSRVAGLFGRHPTIKAGPSGKTIEELQLSYTSFKPVYAHEMKLKQAYLPPFDARSQWPNCIHGVRDQQYCGSCWTFSASGMLEDRFCIASNEAINNGGYITESVNYLITEGLVTEDCMPYTSGVGQQGFCSFSCTDPNIAYEKYACQAGSAFIALTYDQIMTEVQTNGPIQVEFTVYNDFETYQSGIYYVTDPTIAGGHAVKLIGWDYDSLGQLYWICQNQWGTSWGINGYFNIYAGQAGIDDLGSACLPDLLFSRF